LLLSLGEYEEKELSREERKALLPKLQTIYRDETDPGLHSAAEWLIRHWKEEGCLKVLNDKWAKDQTEREKQLDRIRQAFAQGKEKRAPRWYVNSQGQTMVVIPTPGDFVMGSPPTEADRDDSSPQHTRRISRTFALASTPVTKEQFMGVITEFTNHNMRRYPHPTCPMGGVLWSQAAAYCNWLSRKEDIAEDQWCYEIKGDVIKLKANYLSLTGYRLPTEAEMEYAIRAGAVTSRYYGETDELMPKYAWFQNNSKEMTAPVGSLKPNDFGLFDVQGNVFTWCQESYKPYPTPKGNGVVEDLEDSLVVNPLIPRVLRGGSFYNHSSSLRSARRNDSAPTNEDSSYGFRLARTIAP
jgi:formylglycine-generating enzyme required for sulfatase activity